MGKGKRTELIADCHKCVSSDVNALKKAPESDDNKSDIIRLYLPN